jgi:hypothetical protein
MSNETTPGPFGSAHRILAADPQYVGPHRRYVACLGCFDENAARLQEYDAERAALVAALETVVSGIEDFYTWQQRNPKARVTLATLTAWLVTCQHALAQAEVPR